MYYAHFGLKQPPFKITPNTEFFFAGGNRGAILDALIYAITSGEGIIKVVGEVGSGKTMLCRMLQTLLPEKIESIYLANPSVAPEDVLHAIAFELQLKLPKNADRLQVMQALQTYLLERHADGKQVVIFVEEAQGMPLATLEEIRLLSNLETKHDKLLQIVLFGQPELDVNLDETQIRQLRERITHSFNLGPLQEKEIGEYLIFRLRAAGYFGPHMFSKQAIRKLSKAAAGLVRRVNILADKSLLSAFADNVYQVTPSHVDAAIRDSEFGAERAKHGVQRRIYYAALAILLIGLGLGYTIHQFWGPSRQPAPAQPLAKAELPAPADAAAPVAKAIPPPAPLPTGEHATFHAVSPQGATNISSSAGSTRPQTANSAITVVKEPVELLEQRLSAGKNWLSENPASTVTVQLLGGGDEAQMRSQLETLAGQIELEKIHVFRTSQKGRPFMIMTYGAYPNFTEATLAIQKLPETLLVNHPNLRTIGGIIKETKQFQ